MEIDRDRGWRATDLQLPPKTSNEESRKSGHPPRPRQRRGRVASITPLLRRILSFVFSSDEGRNRRIRLANIESGASSLVRYQENGASPTLLDEILPNFPKKYELTTPDRVFDKEESGHLLARSLPGVLRHAGRDRKHR